MGNDAKLMVRNTLLYNLVFIVLGTILAITVAILLNDIGHAGAKKTYQTLILIPYLISIVIVSYIVYAFLSQDSGFVNNTLLKALGKDSISWYTSPQYWPVILTIVYLWKSFGYNSIIYFATIIGIDTSYYEAARIDGATKWKQVWYITLPSLKPTIITLTLLSIGRIFYSDFGLFYQVPMNSGPLLNATQTIDTYVYRALLTLNDVGRSSAAGFLQSVLGFIVVFTANAIVNKIDKDNALF
jgi:putative aldouronate transport system permease protein